jgi:hypothetical protein
MDILGKYLERVEGDDTFTIRRFDLFLHTHPSFLRFTEEERLAYHKRKQEEILGLANGNEHALFNDPQIRYPFRKHLNGAPGTMSNILTSGYFTLYARLLEGNFGLQVNVLDDMKTIFALASSFPVKNGAFVVDEEELVSVRRILKWLWKVVRTSNTGAVLPFTREWFASYDQFLRAIHKDALESYTFYQTNPTQRSLEQVVSWKVSRATSLQRDEWSRYGYLPSYQHDPYEYYPPYVNPHWRNQLLESYLETLPLLEALFNQSV